MDNELTLHEERYEGKIVTLHNNLNYDDMINESSYPISLTKIQNEVTTYNLTTNLIG